MPDETPTPEEREQLARSIALSGSLGGRERMRVMGYCGGWPAS